MPVVDILLLLTFENPSSGLMHVFLTGFMGSGKSSAGKRLARILDFPFIDIDQEISLEYKMSVSDIFKRYDEDVFRLIEKSVLRRVALLDTPHVISAGGGTPCHYDNMNFMLRNGITVYLHLEVPVLVNRLRSSHNKRPLVDTADNAELTNRVQSLLAEREKYYRMSDIHFDARNLNIQQLASAVKEGIARKASGTKSK